ncbi:hypothetical protein ScPMuIL_013847 [Solemya velum]
MSRSGFPIASKILLRYEQDRAYKLHRRKVSTVKPGLDNRPPKKYPHLIFRLKQMQKEEDRQSEIDHANRLLLEKMTHVMQHRGGIDNWNEHEPRRGLNIEYKERQKDIIHQENVELSKRINRVKPTFNPDEWDLYADDFEDDISVKSADKFPKLGTKKDRGAKSWKSESQVSKLPKIPQAQKNGDSRNESKTTQEQGTPRNVSGKVSEISVETFTTTGDENGRDMNRFQVQANTESNFEMQSPPIKDETREYDGAKESPGIDDTDVMAEKTGTKIGTEQDDRSASLVLEPSGGQNEIDLDSNGNITDDQKQKIALTNLNDDEAQTSSLDETSTEPTDSVVNKMDTYVGGQAELILDDTERILGDEPSDGMSVLKWQTDWLNVMTPTVRNTRNRGWIISAKRDTNVIAPVNAQETLDTDRPENSKEDTSSEQESVPQTLEETETIVPLPGATPGTLLRNRAETAEHVQIADAETTQNIVNDQSVVHCNDDSQETRLSMHFPQERTTSLDFQTDAVSNSDDRKDPQVFNNDETQTGDGDIDGDTSIGSKVVTVLEEQIDTTKKRQLSEERESINSIDNSISIISEDNKYSSVASDEPKPWPKAQHGPEPDVNMLFRAAKQMASADDVIIKTLARKTYRQRMQMKQKFKEHYDLDLADELKAGLGEDWHVLLDGLLKERPQSDTRALRDALKNKDYTRAVELMCTRSSNLQELKESYRKEFAVSLESDIKEYTQEPVQLLLLCLHKGRKVQTNKVDQAEAEKDAEALHESGDGRWTSENGQFIKVLTEKSLFHLKAVVLAYRQGYGTDASVHIEEDCPKEYAEAVITLINCLKGPHSHIADKLHSHMHPMDPVLVNTLVDKVVDIGNIKRAYKRRYAVELTDDIKHKCAHHPTRRILLDLASRDNTLGNKAHGSKGGGAVVGSKNSDHTTGDIDKPEKQNKNVKAKGHNGKNSPPQEQPKQKVATKEKQESATKGTISAAKYFDQDEDCEKIKKAMFGVETDQDIITEILTKRSNQQRQQLKKRYKEKYNSRSSMLVVDLTNELKDELTGQFKDVVLALLMSPGEYDTHCSDQGVGDASMGIKGSGQGNSVKSCGEILHDCFADLDNKTDILIRIIVSHSETDLGDIKIFYKQSYKTSLYDTIRAECGGDYTNILLAIVGTD